MMNEQQLEDLCIGWFQATGWQLVHRPVIAPEGDTLLPKLLSGDKEFRP